MDLLDQVKLENLDEEQKALAELIGLDGLKNLVRAYNGTSIYVPKIESLEKAVRDEYIKEEFDGGNYRELALKYGLTETWMVRYHYSIWKSKYFSQLFYFNIVYFEDTLV